MIAARLRPVSKPRQNVAPHSGQSPGDRASGAGLRALAGLASCEEAPARAGGVWVDTLRGGRVAVSSPDSPSSRLARVPTLVEELRIGSVEGDCDAFANVISLAVDDHGRIHVADLGANTVRVFSPQGACLRTVGREGSGPGEFRMLAGIVRSPHSLWAMDASAHRLTVFDSVGAVRASLSLGPSMSVRFPWPLWVDNDGRVHRWAVPFRVPDGTIPISRSTYLVRHGSGETLAAPDTFRIPSLDRRVETYSRTDANLTEISPVPHSPAIVLTVDGDGDVWLANQAVFDLHKVTYQGDTAKTVRLRRPPAPLDGLDRQRIAAATGVPPDRLPDNKLSLRSIHSGANGWLWVATETGAVREWEVFDEQGVYIGRIASPVPLDMYTPPVFGAETIIGIVRDPLDVQYVVRLRIIRQN